MSMIHWESSENHLLFNTRMPAEETQTLLAILKDTPSLQGQIWLTTSGSAGSRGFKWVALSKKGILVSARAVNKHLQSSASDVWINPLPEFHVGGLGILARAHLSGAQVIDFKQMNPKWNPFLFHAEICKCKATLSALVPAQVFDLVANGLQAPQSLRGLIVGGGCLHEALYDKALELGWKLLPSYGLTECSSQVATASLTDIGDPSLIPLEHVQIEVDEKGCIRIKSDSLLTAYGILANGHWELNDPKTKGWFVTEDKGLLQEGILSVLGRGEGFVKIGGESTNLQRLENILNEIKLNLKMAHDLALLAIPDERLGHVIHLAVMDGCQQMINSLVEQFQIKVLPFERIRKIHQVKEIPRSPLKKILRHELMKLIT